MPKFKCSTRLEGELFTKAKALVDKGAFESMTAVIEDALKVYFSNYSTQVWEKHLNGGWLKKLIVRSNKVTFESIRVRKLLTYCPKYYTDEALESKGWRKVWKMKKEA